MNIIVLTGSPHKDGTSSILADKFIAGASEKGHFITRFDAAFLNVHDCMACNHCERGTHPCGFDDDMTDIYKKLKEADLVVFVTPLYYHVMTAALKLVIDRFFGIDDILRGSGKKTCLLATAEADTVDNFDGLKAWYKTSMGYLQWQIAGELYAGSVAVAEDIMKTNYPDQAYELGKSF